MCPWPVLRGDNPATSVSRNCEVISIIALGPSVVNAIPIHVCHPEWERDPFFQDKLAPMSSQRRMVTSKTS